MRRNVSKKSAAKPDVEKENTKSRIHSKLNELKNRIKKSGSTESQNSAVVQEELADTFKYEPTVQKNDNPENEIIVSKQELRPISASSLNNSPSYNRLGDDKNRETKESSSLVLKENDKNQNESNIDIAKQPNAIKSNQEKVSKNIKEKLEVMRSRIREDLLAKKQEKELEDEQKKTEKLIQKEVHDVEEKDVSSMSSLDKEEDNYKITIIEDNTTKDLNIKPKILDSMQPIKEVPQKEEEAIEEHQSASIQSAENSDMANSDYELQNKLPVFDFEQKKKLARISLKQYNKSVASISSLDLNNMMAFAYTPLEPGTTLQMTMIRDSDSLGKKLLPEIHLVFSENVNYHVLSAKKKMTTTRTSYVISLDKKEFSSSKSSYCGNLSGSFLGSEFILHDIGQKPPKSGHYNESLIRSQLASIRYEKNVFGTKGPRKFQILIPALSEGEPLTFRQTKVGFNELRAINKTGSDSVISFTNCPPTWSEGYFKRAPSFCFRFLQSSRSAIY